MYCLASRYQTSLQDLDRVIKIFKEQAVPLVSHREGFKGVYLMTKSNGEFTILNIWDTEARAKAWPENPEHQKVVAQLRPLLAGAPIREGFEVRGYVVA